MPSVVADSRVEALEVGSHGLNISCLPKKDEQQSSNLYIQDNAM